MEQQRHQTGEAVNDSYYMYIFIIVVFTIYFVERRY